MRIESPAQSTREDEAAGSGPPVCVVVSAYNRSWLLPDLIAALKAQTLAGFEAVLIDNGSTDDTHAVLCRLTHDDKRFLVLRLADNAGPARARNLGWRAARAPLVAFSDDDCAPSRSWLEELVDTSSSVDIVQGKTIPADRGPDVRPGWFDRTQHIRKWSGRFETCNLAVRRSVLEAHDGFDEQFPIAMGEDTDLGLRAVAGGATTAFAPAALVRHHRWKAGFSDYLRHRRRYAESVQLMKINPSARGLLRWGFITRDVHVLVWGLVPAIPVSVMLGVPWFTPGAALAWSVVNAYRTRGTEPFSAPKRVAYSLVNLVGYGYEAVCFLAASVRYRALVI